MSVPFCKNDIPRQKLPFFKNDFLLKYCHKSGRTFCSSNDLEWVQTRLVDKVNRSRHISASIARFTVQPFASIQGGQHNCFKGHKSSEKRHNCFMLDTVRINIFYTTFAFQADFSISKTKMRQLCLTKKSLKCVCFEGCTALPDENMCVNSYQSYYMPYFRS